MTTSIVYMKLDPGSKDRTEITARVSATSEEKVLVHGQDISFTIPNGKRRILLYFRFLYIYSACIAHQSYLAEHT